MVTYALLWLCRVQYILVRPHTVLYNLDLYGPVLFHMFQIGLICSHRSVWSIKTDGVQDGLLGSQKFWFGPMWFGLEHCCLIWLHMVQYFQCRLQEIEVIKLSTHLIHTTFVCLCSTHTKFAHIWYLFCLECKNHDTVAGCSVCTRYQAWIEP